MKNSLVAAFNEGIQLEIEARNKIEAKCLRNVDFWFRYSLGFDETIYNRYVAFNQWISELSDDDLATFYLLVAHSEFDK